MLTNYINLDELLNYGTDAQCRAALEAIANEMHANGMKSYEELVLAVDDLQSRLDDLQSRLDEIGG